ncbi:CC171 protein, partial [Peucedramus taeniatus]|nr:CC171 protein [Peucedramus taeniatus]
ILQQEIFEFSRRLHAAEVESHSLHMQLAECSWALAEMRKDAEKAHILQDQLNELQRVSTTYFSFQKINQDNIQEELDKALQREHQVRLLLQEHQRRLQELSDRLEAHSFSNTDSSQFANLSLTRVPDSMKELKSTDLIPDQQQGLLKEMQQDQEQLWETLKEAEHALKQAAK